MSQVNIIDYKERINSDGEPFFALILEGDLEMVQSSETGRYYATARRTSITSTFNEETCKRMIGRSMPGSIQKVDSEPYEYTVPESGEIITLSHRWEYQPEASMEDEIFERKTNGAEKPALV